MAETSGQQPRLKRNLPAVRIFWGVFAGITLGVIGILQYLGPPAAPQPLATDIRPAAAPALETTPPAAIKTIALPVIAKPQRETTQPETLQIGTGSTLAQGMPIPSPVPALLAPSLTMPDWLVPHIGPDGMTPMRAYSASSSARPGPHLAILIAGIGDDDTQSQEAVTTLPAAVSLAVTPYGQHITDIAALARASGHEILLSIPMQEADPVTENAGNEALVMAGPITLDQPMLDWSFAQLQGYAGVTDAIGVSQGAGFMYNPNAKAWLLQEIADMGLFFIDARPSGAVPYAWNRTADVVIDPVQAPQQEPALLAELAADARLQGTAMGILLNPAPQALQTLQKWIQTLDSQGITLVPVSALVLPPVNPIAVTPAAATVSP